MKTTRALLFFVTAVSSIASCYFHVGTGPAPAEMQAGSAAPAVPPPPATATTTASPRPASAPATTAAPTSSAKPTPPLTPAAVDALLRGTWRTVSRSVLLPGSSAQSASPPPAPPAGCIDVSAAGVVPLCTPQLGACMVIAAQRCAAYSRAMVPSVASAAVGCINGLSATQQCDPLQLDNCGHAALARACPEPGTVGPLCEVAAGPCKSSKTECIALVSGLAPDVQDSVARCIAKGCPSGLYACVEGLGASLR